MKAASANASASIASTRSSPSARTRACAIAISHSRSTAAGLSEDTLLHQHGEAPDLPPVLDQLRIGDGAPGFEQLMFPVGRSLRQPSQKFFDLGPILRCPAQHRAATVLLVARTMPAYRVGQRQDLSADQVGNYRGGKARRAPSTPAYQIRGHSRQTEYRIPSRSCGGGLYCCI